MSPKNERQKAELHAEATSKVVFYPRSLFEYLSKNLISVQVHPKHDILGSQMALERFKSKEKYNPLALLAEALTLTVEHHSFFRCHPEGELMCAKALPVDRSPLFDHIPKADFYFNGAYEDWSRFDMTSLRTDAAKYLHDCAYFDQSTEKTAEDLDAELDAYYDSIFDDIDREFAIPPSRDRAEARSANGTANARACKEAKKGWHGQTHDTCFSATVQNVETGKKTQIYMRDLQKYLDAGYIRITRKKRAE